MSFDSLVGMQLMWYEVKLFFLFHPILHHLHACICEFGDHLRGCLERFEGPFVYLLIMQTYVEAPKPCKFAMPFPN
jgi:hypothetical protein